MPKFIASYDLENTYPSPYGPFLEAAEAFGWFPWIKSSSGKWYRLPNTTLIGDFSDLEAAVAALRATRAATEDAIGTQLRIQKWIVSERLASKFESDEIADD